MTHLVETAEAVAITRLSSETLRRRARDGKLSQFPHPRDSRRKLYDRAELEALAAPEEPAEDRSQADPEDLAILRFTELCAEYEEGTAAGDLTRYRRLLEATPANIVPPLLDLAVMLAYGELERSVSEATPEEIAAAKATHGTPPAEV